MSLRDSFDQIDDGRPFRDIFDPDEGYLFGVYIIKPVYQVIHDG
jgi:hypothetical protein